MKKTYTFLVIALTSLTAFGQVTLPHYDGFNYTVGQSLNRQISWGGLISPTDENDVSIIAGNLSYSGLSASSGNKINFSALSTGSDPYKLITPQNSGTVYYSFLLKINSMAGATNPRGMYIASFLFDEFFLGGTLWTKRVDDTNFNLGIEVRTVNVSNTFSATSYQTGQTYLIVVSYTFNSGASNDIVKLWVNPIINGSEPTSTVTDSHTETDVPKIDGFRINAGLPNDTPNVEIDELRIGTSWASVTPSGPLNITQNNISGLNIYPNPVVNGTFYVDTDADAIKSVSIFDVLGKEVSKTTISGNTVNVNNLRNGVYIVKITEAGKTATKKLVIR